MGEADESGQNANQKTMPYFPIDHKKRPTNQGLQKDVPLRQAIFLLVLLFAGLLISILVVRFIDPRSMRGGIGLTHVLIAMPSPEGETV